MPHDRANDGWTPPPRTPLPPAPRTFVLAALVVPVVAAIPVAVLLAVVVAGRDPGAAALATPLSVLGTLVAAGLAAAAFALLPAPSRERIVAVVVLAVLALLDVAVVIGLPALADALHGALAVLAGVNLVLALLLHLVPLLLWLRLRGRPPSTRWVLVLPVAALLVGVALQGVLGAFGELASASVGGVLLVAVQQAALLGAAALAASIDPRP